MNDLDVFRAMVRHERSDRFLYKGSFTPDLENRLRQKHGLSQQANLHEYFGMFQPLQVAPVGSSRVKPDFSKYFEDMEKPGGSFINWLGVLEIPANFHHFTGYISPLRNARTLEDIENFPFPDEGEIDVEEMKKCVEEAHQSGRVAFTWVGHMYENAWQVRDYEKFLVDMMERPEWCECILDRFAAHNRKIAVAAARAGVDYIATGDDVANQKALMFSPITWRRFIQSRWAGVYAAAREAKPDIQIWYHSDGNIEAIIPEMIEIGMTILNPVQPECMDPADLKRRYGKQLIFDGGIGTQTTMPFGSTEEVRRVVRECKRTLGSDGAYILSPTHILEPEVPLENIEALFDEARN